MNSPFQDWKKEQEQRKWAARAAYALLALLLLAISCGQVPF